MSDVRGPSATELHERATGSHDRGRSVDPVHGWAMPQGRGPLGGCGATDQTGGPCAGEESPDTERGSSGGMDTSSANGHAAVPRYASLG